MTEQKLQPVRGTKDLYGNDIQIFNHIIKTARDISVLYGFNELSTPIFEFSEIYERNLGESSDIISKEVYKFPDRGDNFLTLRPEFTAGVVRAFISNSMQQNLPQKLFSYGPVFRYDRPQKGRQRQFNQINFELIGAVHFLNDVEMIALSCRILKALGVLEKTTLQINSLGCEVSRENYQNALVKYFKKHQDNLSEISKTRLEKNPLRILDSKDEGDIEIVKNAPKITDFYETEARNNLQNILNSLDNLNIKYVHNPRLVRGLDYYNGAVFEFVTGDLGAQNTVLAGGRYDKLIAKMGGSDTPAVGFAAGIERLMLMSDFEIKNNRSVSVIYVSDNERSSAIGLVETLRNAGISAEIYYDNNMKKQIRRATQINSQLVIFLGESELTERKLKIKDFDSGKEEKVDFDSAVQFIKNY